MDQLEKDMSENFMNLSFEELESSLISMCEGNDCNDNSFCKEDYNSDSFSRDDCYGDIFVRDCNDDNFCKECHCESFCKEQDVSLLTKLIDRNAKKSCNCIDNGDTLMIQDISQGEKDSIENDRALKSTVSSFAKWIFETLRFKPQIADDENTGITCTSSKNLRLDNDCFMHDIQFNNSKCSIVKSNGIEKTQNTSEKNKKRLNLNKGLKDSIKENLQKYPDKWLDMPKMPKKNFNDDFVSHSTTFTNNHFQNSCQTATKSYSNLENRFKCLTDNPFSDSTVNVEIEDTSKCSKIKSDSKLPLCDFNKDNFSSLGVMYVDSRLKNKLESSLNDISNASNIRSKMKTLNNIRRDTNINNLLELSLDDISSGYNINKQLEPTLKDIKSKSDKSSELKLSMDDFGTESNLKINLEKSSENSIYGSNVEIKQESPKLDVLCKPMPNSNKEVVCVDTDFLPKCELKLQLDGNKSSVGMKEDFKALEGNNFCPDVKYEWEAKNINMTSCANEKQVYDPSENSLMNNQQKDINMLRDKYEGKYIHDFENKNSYSPNAPVGYIIIDTRDSELDPSGITCSDNEDKLLESDMELSPDSPDNAIQQIICEENHSLKTCLNQALIENNSANLSPVSHSETLLSGNDFWIDETSFKNSRPQNHVNEVQKAKVGSVIAQNISQNMSLIQNYDKQNIKLETVVTEAMPDSNPISEIPGTHSTNTENIPAPFESKDPQENRDIENPEWDHIRELKTDEEHYRKVRSLWMNASVPNPNRDVTFHSFRKKRLQKTSFIKRRIEKSVRKRVRTNDDDVALPCKRARTKTKSCIDIFDEKIQEHQEQLAWQHRKILMEMKESENNLENQLRLKHDEITHAYKIQMAQYSRRNPKNIFQQLHTNYWTLNKDLAELRMWQNIKRQNLYNQHNEQIHTIRTEVERLLENLSEARQEVLNFNKFYLGLSSDEDTTLLTDSQLQEIQEAERTYKQYNVLYACPTFM